MPITHKSQIYPPMLALESAATKTPSLNIEASVVAPFAGFTICIAFFRKPSNYKTNNNNQSPIPPTPNQPNHKTTLSVTGRWNDGAENGPSYGAPSPAAIWNGANDSSPVVSRTILPTPNLAKKGTKIESLITKSAPTAPINRYQNRNARIEAPKWGSEARVVREIDVDWMLASLGRRQRAWFGREREFGVYGPIQWAVFFRAAH